MRNFTTLGGERFKPGQIGLDHLFVDLLGKQQRDVDVDAVGGQVVNGRQAFRRRRDFDHQIFAVDFPPQSPRLIDGCLGVHRQIGRHFNADKAIGAVGGIEYRTQHVGRAANILDRELLEDLPGRMVLLLQHPADGVVILIGSPDRLLENRRI